MAIFCRFCRYTLRLLSCGQGVRPDERRLLRDSANTRSQHQRRRV
ncbi:hypothetical protein [Candidatus Regiella insecticola]|nr:hypothetical protein [Candidatus Regiella insecticola]